MDDVTVFTSVLGLEELEIVHGKCWIRCESSISSKIRLPNCDEQAHVFLCQKPSLPFTKQALKLGVGSVSVRLNHCKIVVRHETSLAATAT